MVNLKNIFAIRIIIYSINLIVILFMSILIYRTTELICFNDKAREFLEKVRYIPTTPWKIPAFSVILLILLIISVMVRERYLKEKTLALYAFALMDIMICITIMYYLNLSYKGIILLAIANIVTYIEGKKRKFIFLAIAIPVYILFDYDIFSIKVSMFSINDYIQYYSSSQRLYIFSIRNILTSMNEMAFILFMIFVIQSEIDENTKIKELNTRLYETAKELTMANTQLEEYAKKSEEMAQTRERNRLAREIHDTIGHALTGITTGLEACIELIEIDVKKTKEQLIKIVELSRKGLLDVRRSVKALRPDALERFELVPAIRMLVEDIRGCTNTQIHLDVQGQSSQINADEEETIYRVVQESVTNAVRHGSAKTIDISLAFEDFKATLTVKNDGIGTDSIKEGFGLRHIRERVEMLGGHAEFISNAESGFITKAEIPILWGK